MGVLSTYPSSPSSPAHRSSIGRRLNKVSVCFCHFILISMSDSGCERLRWMTAERFSVTEPSETMAAIRPTPLRKRFFKRLLGICLCLEPNCLRGIYIHIYTPRTLNISCLHNITISSHKWTMGQFGPSTYYIKLSASGVRELSGMPGHANVTSIAIQAKQHALHS